MQNNQGGFTFEALVSCLTTSAIVITMFGLFCGIICLAIYLIFGM